jgi:ubiquinone/menaquinone biosynthesis C-methylase UbiE
VPARHCLPDRRPINEAAVTLCDVNDWRSYDRVADTYERVHAPRFVEVARDLYAMTAGVAGDRVLDVGTGTGVAAAVASEGGARATGVDASVGMLSVARRAHPGLKLVAAEAIDLPFGDDVFDTVIGSFVLAHFTKIETALFDVIRVVKRNGRVAFSAWADGPDAYQDAWRGMIESVVPREMLGPAYREAAPWHERFRSRAAVEEAMIDAGLRRVRTEIAKYRWTYPRDDYLEGLEVFATGRFVREMLGESGWADFAARVRAEFAERFPDPLNDFRDVILAVGTKP